jgi:hypothetical protein
MRHFIILLFTVTFSVCHGQTSDRHLFQIFENGKIGFINLMGQVVIQPTFRSAGEFSEGLASARTNGTYGYIDETGKFVIPPQFDYATPFSEGMAVVYKDGHPFFINKQGQKPFETNFSSVGQFENGRAIIQTSTKKMGFIGKHGKLIIDTVFTKINSFVNGFAVVQGTNHHPYADSEKGIEKKLELGVIDSLGQFIIPYGKYEKINDFVNGYFRVVIPAESWDTIKGYSTQTGFIDKNGKLILAKDHKNHCWIDGNIHCGLAKMNLYKYWQQGEKGTSYTTEKSYEGFINLKGEIVINDTTYESVKDFSDNRAFIENEDRNYFIIDTKGKIISKDTFYRIVGDGFKNGIAFVEKDGKYGMIDTNAFFLIKPQFEGIDEIGIIDDYFFFFDWNQDENSNYDKLYGIAKKDGSILLKPTMQKFNRNGFQNGILTCLVNNKLTYINKEGKVIWQASDNKLKQLTNLNIDFMNRGYFYAYSKPNKNDIGGFGSSENIPQNITSTGNFTPNTLSVSVQTKIKDTIFGDCNGITVFIANTSKMKIDFNAQDSRLHMKVQALNSKGEWKDIEYLPSSWCGNSYHTLTLEPNNFWTFLTPIYEGEFKTKLRIELKHIDSEDKSEKSWEKNEITIYSNEYEGSINPGQFWRKQDYYPGGIMDPYND